MHNATPVLSLVPDPDAPSLLTPDDERRLVRRIDAGVAARAALCGWCASPVGASTAELRAIAEDGERARVEFARANTGLVWWVVAQSTRWVGEERDELFQEGMIGLMEAIQRFDPGRSRLVTYAIPRIRMRVWDAAVTAHGRLGITARRARQWRCVRAAVARLTVALARAPRPDEVAEATGESVSVVESLLAFVPPVCLAPDAPGWEAVAPAGPQPAASEEVDRAAVRRLLRRLEALDRVIVTHLYGLEGPVRTHAEVARLLGRSESTIRRRERTALDLLRAGTAARLAA